jgi:hypothetical protein
MIGRWEDNIKSDLREIECDDVEWIHLVQYRAWLRALVNTAINFRIP